MAATLLALIAPQAASAQGNPPSPPNNSAVSQYLESIPTAAGGEPTNRIRPKRGAHRGGNLTGGGGPSTGGGTGGSTGGAAGGGRGTGSGAGSTSTGAGDVSATTYKALTSQGSVGAGDAAFARATAPAAANQRAASGGASDTPVSPTSAVLKSLTGAATSGGLGPLLPAILVLAVLAGGLLAAVRRRTRRAGP